MAPFYFQIKFATFSMNLCFFKKNRTNCSSSILYFKWCNLLAKDSSSYLKVYEEDPLENDDILQAGIKLEIRELNALKEYPLIMSEMMTTHLEVLSVIGSVYTYIQDKEWERDSAEIDEDRKVYVLIEEKTKGGIKGTTIIRLFV